MDLEGIESGSEEFSKVISSATDGCGTFLFFFSEQSQKADWSLKELRYAKSDNKRVVLVRIDDSPKYGAFKLEFSGSDIIDWCVPEQKEKLQRDLRQRHDVSSAIMPNCRLAQATKKLSGRRHNKLFLPLYLFMTMGMRTKRLIQVSGNATGIKSTVFCVHEEIGLRSSNT